MLGLMQEWPLLCHKLIDHAERQHGSREVVSRSIEGPIVRTTFAEIHHRAAGNRRAFCVVDLRGDLIDATSFT